MKTPWTFLGKVRHGNVVGPLVSVRFTSFGDEDVMAKIDTGAYSGAIHATHIEEAVTGNGEKVLAFNPLGKKSNRIQISAYHKRRVRSSNGEMAERFAIDTEIEIAGTIYPITITLANRKSMKYPALIGRNFLRNHGFVVDLRQLDS